MVSLTLFLKFGDDTKRVSTEVPSLDFLIELCREKFAADSPTIRESPSEAFAFWVKGLD
jgi:hypothetical protein